jgi:hypothetical protein
MPTTLDFLHPVADAAHKCMVLSGVQEPETLGNPGKSVKGTPFAAVFR